MFQIHGDLDIYYSKTNCCHTCSPLCWGNCQDNPDKILQSVFHKIEGRLGPTRPPSRIWLSGLSSCLSPLSQPWKTFNRHKQLQLQSWISFFLLTPWSSLEEKWTPLAPQWVLNLCTSISLGLYLNFPAYWSYISLAMISWFIIWMIMYMLFWVYLVLFAVFGLYSLCTFCRLSFFGNSILMFSFFDWYGLVVSYLCCLSDIPLALPSVSFTLPPPMSGTSS